jgi:hypothetical protein
MVGVSLDRSFIESLIWRSVTWRPGTNLPDAVGTSGWGQNHSHLIILIHGNALIQRRKFLCARRRTVSAIRQQFALLISKENFVESDSARFQELSTSIGRFSTSPALARHPLIGQKYRQRVRCRFFSDASKPPLIHICGILRISVEPGLYGPMRTRPWPRPPFAAYIGWDHRVIESATLVCGIRCSTGGTPPSVRITRYFAPFFRCCRTSR